ncbi:MAG: VWA domain-containing protein [Candidatus Bipolaricaulis sp.]|nr:VWA domain-containing protein [Candidatus Bipolaricaulis sp.]
MIRFGVPWALALLPVLAALLALGRARLRELAVPALAAVALVVALAQPELREAERVESVCVLVDRSPSITAAVPDVDLEDVLAPLRSVTSGRRLGVVAFASRATVLHPLSADAVPWEPFTGRGELGTRTDLASAVNVALAAFPEGGANQIVLASDGRITEGLEDAVVAAAAARVPISTFPLGRTVEEDVALASLEVPARLEVGRPFRAKVEVDARASGEAVLALYRDGELVSSHPVALRKGLTGFQIEDTLSATGTYTYRAIVRRPGDPIAENDALSAFAEAEGPAPLLVVASEEPATLAALLAALDRPYETRSSVPPLETLADYRTVLLTGLPLGRLRADEIQTLRSFVADLGGALLVAEGEDELRGVRGGGIEDLLPVSYTIPQDAERASLAVVYVLDRSGSMQGLSGGAEKIDVLREVAAASIGLLEADALVGVIAFDRDVEWVHPLGAIRDTAAIHGELQMLRASGGTDVYYPVVAALDALETTSARVKHILLVSDGRTVNEARDWEGLLTRLEAQEDVHLSVIAVGYEPNRQLLDRLAAAGHGGVLAASDYAALPQISMEATQSLLRSRFVHGVTPVSGPLASGDLTAIPPVLVYVLTHPRPTAEVLLLSAGDPLFARWRLGLGRVGVLNTDLAGAGSKEWLSWDRGPLLLETLLGSVETETWAPYGLRLTVEVVGAGVQVRVEGREADGTLTNFLDLAASVLPGGTSVPLEQTNVGLYEGMISTPAEGGYALRVVDRTRDRVAWTPFSVPYADEYRGTGVEEATLRAIAEATGGRFLADSGLPDLPSGSGARSYRPIHAQLLLLALVLFLLEVGRRKLLRRFGKP